MHVVYCGNGSVGTRCLEVLRSFPFQISICESENVLAFLQNWDDEVDLILSVHWPLLFSMDVILHPKVGILNLHNSLLPWNRGADSCSWAIIDSTPHGATMHWIEDERIDAGPILVQKSIEILDDDTTDSLYKRTSDLEVEVFKLSMDKILQGNFEKSPQQGVGSFHRKSDFQKILRAATTSTFEVIKR